MAYFKTIIQNNAMMNSAHNLWNWKLGSINQSKVQGHVENQYILWLIDPSPSNDCKQRALLGNARNIQACNNRTTGLCKPFLNKGSVNMPTIRVLLETVFSIRSVQSGYKEEFSWESAVEFRGSKWAVSQEMSSAREAEKMSSGVVC
jgi:hypothetical protein